MTSTISFFSSLVIIIGMIGLKSIEMRRGHKFFSTRIAEKSDHIFQAIYNGVRNAIAYINKHNAIALIQVIAYHILSWARSVYLRIQAKAHAHPHSKKVIDMVKGKGEVDKNGGASFYLKKISEDN